jgi:hypothetical protein
MAKRPAPPVTRGIMSDTSTSPFWQGFISWIGFAIAGSFVVGLILGSYAHPYEQCKRMYDTQEDVMECVWIKENPQ